MKCELSTHTIHITKINVAICSHQDKSPLDMGGKLSDLVLSYPIDEGSRKY